MPNTEGITIISEHVMSQTSHTPSAAINYIRSRQDQSLITNPATYSANPRTAWGGEGKTAEHRYSNIPSNVGKYLKNK